MNNTTTQTGITHVGTIIVPVSDHERSIPFYTEQLGFEKRMDVAYGEGERWVEIAPAGAESSIALSPTGPTAGPGSVTNISFATTDVEATHAELRARGIDVDAEVSRFGDPVPPLFFLRDPDGNQLMVVEREPASG
ncbi:MAG TPA: VOC family protein [Solirubrobacteraceae bacterium]|nr:VOC family protein [Solirubrobacteraceae bacterium]